MSKVLSSGTLEGNGETVAYTYRRGFRLPKSNEWNNSIEADFHGHHIVIDDHGGGLEYALSLLRNDISLKQERKKTV
jgi:hypothetical protein